jgi:hypothetical protein
LSRMGNIMPESLAPASMACFPLTYKIFGLLQKM